MSTEPPIYGRNGYVSDVLSDGEGGFLSAPSLTMTFSGVHDVIIPGVTVVWSQLYGEWATEYTVAAYHGERLVFFASCENSDVKSVMAQDIRDYDKIVISILRWSKPYHRARVESLFLGIETSFEKAELMSFSASMFVDPVSASLPKSEINFTIPNVNGEYNPDNPNGLSKYLMERQEVSVRYGFKLERIGKDGEAAEDIEWISGGKFFLSEWDTPQNGITAGFTARDALEFLSDTYTGPKAGTLGDIARAAFNQAELPVMEDGSPRWIIDASLDSVLAPESLEEGTELDGLPISTVLQYVANAGCCVFYQDRAGLIHIEPLRMQQSDYSIDRFNSYANAELSLLKQLKAVNINNGQHILTVGRAGEVQPVSNPLISDGQAPAVAAWISDYLQNRRVLTGEFRADPRLDPLDLVHNENQFARAAVLITDANFTYNGAFRGSYSGRTMQSEMTFPVYSGTIYSGVI